LGACAVEIYDLILEKSDTQHNSIIQLKVTKVGNYNEKGFV